MAKKNTKKTKEITPMVENTTASTNITNATENITDFVQVEKIATPDYGDLFDKPKMKYMTLIELESYERLLRMLVLYYEQNLRLDESEGRPVMSENRNRYTRLSVLHKRLMQFIENKVIKLEDYDWEG